MPRGFKRDRARTDGFQDQRSFISLDGHLILYGKDKLCQRVNVYAFSNPEHISWEEGEWHHLRNKHNNFRRCDCAAGGLWVRRGHAKTMHVQVQWTKKTQAAEEFEKLYKEKKDAAK
jgi:hypothetical protein